MKALPQERTSDADPWADLARHRHSLLPQRAAGGVYCLFNRIILILIERKKI
jgi:hypothetical protein